MLLGCVGEPRANGERVEKPFETSLLAGSRFYLTRFWMKHFATSLGEVVPALQRY
jgi:hypothetical protein